MTFIATALHTIHTAAIYVFADDDTEFNADKVTPGPEGFIVTAVFAAAVLVLGFLLVRRIRRNSYRSEIREDIAAELAANDETGTGGGEAEDPQKSSDS